MLIREASSYRGEEDKIQLCIDIFTSLRGWYYGTLVGLRNKYASHIVGMHITEWSNMAFMYRKDN